MLKNKGYIIKLRQSKTFKGIVVCMLLNFIAEIVQPTMALALTEGPSQPEVQSFEPIGTTQMVDMFSGDFNYNIPLFNLPGPNGGYPVNLAYHAGPTMDDEASWVGLGWNLNVGSLVRSLRGIPDEFKSVEEDGQAKSDGDFIEVKSDMKKNWTLGISGSLSFEAVGGDVIPDNLSASVYYNSFAGVGLSFGASWESNQAGDLSMAGGLSMDSENGLGVNARLSYDKKLDNNYDAKHSLSLSFDGKLSADYSISAGKESNSSRTDKDGLHYDVGQSIGSGISFARDNFSPAQSRSFDTYSLNVTAKLPGGQVAVTTTSGALGIFFNIQDLNNADKNGRKLPVMGYEQSGTDDSEKYTLDFSRFSDGLITKSNMFLAYPIYNYDTYNPTGQGLSGYFRPRRKDIGRVHDPKNRNDNYGLNITTDVGAGGTAKLGIGIGVSYGFNTQEPWNDLNDLELNFISPSQGGINENLYYQAHGESTISALEDFNYMNGFALPIVKLDSNDGDHVKRRKINSSGNTGYSDNGDLSKRKVRNALIHNLKNYEVANLGEFKVNYFTNETQITQTLNAPATLIRSVRSSSKYDNTKIGNHPAGYKVLNQEGSYYVYALPAYNNIEIENTFTVDMQSEPHLQDPVMGLNVPSGEDEVNYKVTGTNKFIRKTTKTPYAHSYLLTSVQGADYVDITNNGPTDDDLGYWVKFNYLKKSDNFKWRSPYGGAFYNRGEIHTSEDDMGSYQYGEKELWYVAQIETKSHVAIFHLGEREDMLEAEGEFADIGDVGSQKPMYIKKIEVFEKGSFNSPNPVALQTVHFSYTNELCPGVPNNSAQGGKLTLKKVYFTSNGSTRGEYSKYEFDYGTSENNPSFEANAYDSWGSYKPQSGHKEHASQFPYTNQFNDDWTNYAWEPTYGGGLSDKEVTYNEQARLTSAWSLKKIKLPSGGEINIEYESDDYGYVQHKTANQMFKIKRMGIGMEPDELYNQNNQDLTEPNRRIYFKLEEPIDINSGINTSQYIYDRYVKPIIQDENGQRNLYFKTKMRLTTGQSKRYEYISGYLPLEEYSATRYGVGDENGVSAEGGFHRYGFVTLKKTPKKQANEYFDKYHPMALAGWTYLQTNAPKMLNNSLSYNTDGTYNALGQILGAVVNMVSVAQSAAQNFGFIRKYCKEENLCRYIDLDRSCIRLASPDKSKYGGGHRVKSIKINDKWSSDTPESDRSYGQEFDYTIMEDGRRISSGVATYEPQLGGDENALKYPIYFHERTSVFTNNNLFTEGPVNEALFPGPSVGYRQVTVKSINTALQEKRSVDANPSDQPRGRTGGVTVHQFYTAKEFPTKVKTSVLKEENSTKDVHRLTVPIPLIGSIKRNLYHGTQAYLIELNDMHGKPKSVKTYELNNYSMNDQPITEQVYEYQTDGEEIYQGERVLKLNSYVNVVSDNNEKSLYWDENNPKLMGVDMEMFTDQRSNKAYDFSLSVDVNLDLGSPAIPLPSVWVGVNKSESIIRTYVTNKVIHRVGILKKTISRDLQSFNETEVIAYDEKSGEALVTKVKNEFGDDFYNYNIPAHYVYNDIGHAYRNINYSFQATLSQLYIEPNAQSYGYVDLQATQALRDNLVVGDEILVQLANYTWVKGYFLGWKYRCESTFDIPGTLHFPGYTSQDILGGTAPVSNIQCKVIRSGRRNHYSSMAANYLTKGKIGDLDDTQTLTTSIVDNTVIKKYLLPEIVLAASATVYSQDWPMNNQSPLQKGETISSPSSTLGQRVKAVGNPFLNGTSGIWRPKKAYSYVGKRKTSGSMENNQDSDPALYNDGVFEGADLPLFTWEIGNLEDYAPNWEWVNEVTRFSEDSYEVENQNRLGIKSSALYGYDNSLSIAVGGNAGFFEIGVDDFETATDQLWTNVARIKQNHLNFHNLPDNEGVIVSEKLTISNAVYDCVNSSLSFKIRKPSDYLKHFFSNAQEGTTGSGGNNTTFGLALVTRKNQVSEGNKNYFLNGALASSDLVIESGVEVLNVSIRPYNYYGLNSMYGAMEFTGTLTTYEHRNLLQKNYENKVTVSSQKAHSGKKSMKVSSGDYYIFDQPMINTVKDKKYVASCWVSRENTDVYTFKPSSEHLITPGISEYGGTEFTPLSSGAYKITYGKIIEGWQKVDIEYSVSTPGKVISFKITPGSNNLFVDDFRISPKTGGMTTYVYDPSKFWLRASLNVDNYATFYYYDEEGNLTIKKQETEKGIFTVTESRGHIKEQEQ